MAEPLLAQLPGGAGPGSRPTAYVGGDYRVATDSPVTSVVLAFEFAGGWKAGVRSVVHHPFIPFTRVTYFAALIDLAGLSMRCSDCVFFFQ